MVARKELTRKLGEIKSVVTFIIHAVGMKVAKGDGRVPGVQSISDVTSPVGEGALGNEGKALAFTFITNSAYSPIFQNWIANFKYVAVIESSNIDIMSGS